MNMLSKSDYMLFLKQPAWLWVKKHDPSKIPPVDEGTQAMFDAGHAFEPYAESLFPEGMSLGFSDFDEYQSLPQRTLDAIESSARVLFQPRFNSGEYTCICDIVTITGDKEVDLYEIKTSTSVKPEHIFDLAFQAAVLEGNGFKVRRISVIHVNNQYVRHGDIEADKLTAFEDITDTVNEKRDVTAKYMPMALAVAKSDTMPDPDPKLAKLGSKNDWMEIYKNIVEIEEPDYSDVEPTINHASIKQFLDGLEYPLYFLDYETMAGLVPYFDGQRPYQQIPFQYSLHILDSPDAELRQTEYLHSENSDPVRPLCEQLIRDCGSTGTIISWNKGFEMGRNTDMGMLYPEFADALAAINSRVVDLGEPFKPANGWYVDPRFESSWSIKKVLPVVVPSLSYKELDIGDGGTAQRLWMEAVLDEKRADEKDKILADLHTYCGLDTLAMVEIYNVLRKL